MGCCLARGSQRVGMSTKKDAARPFGLRIFCLWWRYRTRTARPRRRRGNKHPSGVFVSARFPTHRNVYRDDCRFVVAVQDSNRDKQRQDIPMRAVSCLLLFLIAYGILGSVQQIGIEISYIQRDLITVIFYYQISLKPLKTLSLSQVSFPLLFPLYYIVP